MDGMYPWSKQTVLRQVQSSQQGLISKQAEAARKQFGRNELDEIVKKSGIRIFAEQFRDFLVLILIAAAVISAVLGDWESTLVILAVITLNAVLGTVQQIKAEKSLEGLKQLSAPQTRVLRDGHINLDNFGKKLSVLILIICGILFGLSVLRGEEIIHAFMFAVALAVAAIPEVLSSIVTIVLAFGTKKMVRENVIVRKLQAVEGLGSVSVICSDKTGTLTQNKIICDSVDKCEITEKIGILQNHQCHCCRTLQYSLLRK